MNHQVMAKLFQLRREGQITNGEFYVLSAIEWVLPRPTTRAETRDHLNVSESLVDHAFQKAARYQLWSSGATA